jgi:hypothetical protein
MMNRTLVVTNVFLGIIAICLLLLVASVYGIGVREAHAQDLATPTQVVLMYWDSDSRSYQPVVNPAGYIKTAK